MGRAQRARQAFVWPDQGSAALDWSAIDLRGAARGFGAAVPEEALPEREIERPAPVEPAPARPKRRRRSRSRRDPLPRTAETPLEKARRRARARAATREFLKNGLAVALVFVALAAVVMHSNAVVREGYRVESLKQELAQARDERDRLAAAAGRAVDPAAVATAAQGQMSMSVPALGNLPTVRPLQARAAADDAAPRSEVVALVPAPQPERTLWTALGDWFATWFAGEAVAAQSQSR